MLKPLIVSVRIMLLSRIPGDYSCVYIEGDITSKGKHEI